MTTPRVYVSTYAKYNSGSLKGEWINLEDFSSKDEFMEAAAKLHSDESDPEFMFQDSEGCPDGTVSESSIAEELWDWIALDEDERELLSIYASHFGETPTIDEAREKFLGTFRTPEDWAADWLEQSGELDKIPDNFRNYFDYEAYARDARLNGDVAFVEHNGDVWVFFTN